MKALPLALLVVSLFPAGRAIAHEHDAPAARVISANCDAPARWSARHDLRDASLAINSEDGDATLLLADEVVAVQLSDRTVHRFNRELDNAVDEKDNAVARAIAAAVTSGVKSLFDHSAECAIRDLGAVDYRDGRLVFTAVGGKQVFSGFNLNNRDVLASFSPDDARRFVREFERAKRRQR